MKNTVRAMIRIILRMVALSFALIIGFLFIATVLSIISTRPEPIACESKQEIFLVSNGLHLDFIIPVDLLGEKQLEELVSLVAV